MKNIPFRCEMLQKYLSQLTDINLPRKSVLLLMLIQAEGVVRELKRELGHLPPEPEYEPVTELKIHKGRPTEYVFEPKVCCGKTFTTPQSWAGHKNSAKHRTSRKDNSKQD